MTSVCDYGYLDDGSCDGDYDETGHCNQCGRPPLRPFLNSRLEIPEDDFAGLAVDARRH